MRVNVETNEFFINGHRLVIVGGDVKIPTLSSNDSGLQNSNATISNKVIHGTIEGAPPSSFYAGLTENVSSILQDFDLIKQNIAGMNANVKNNYTGPFSQFISSNDAEHQAFLNRLNNLPDGSGVAGVVVNNSPWTDTLSEKVIFLQANNAAITTHAVDREKIYFIFAEGNSTVNGVAVPTVSIFTFNGTAYDIVFCNSAALIDGQPSNGLLNPYKVRVIESDNETLNIDAYRYSISNGTNLDYLNITINNPYSDPVEITFFTQDKPYTLNVAYRGESHIFYIADFAKVVLHGQYLHKASVNNPRSIARTMPVEFINTSIPNGAFVFLDVATKRAGRISDFVINGMGYTVSLTGPIPFPVIYNPMVDPAENPDIEYIVATPRSMAVYKTTAAAGFLYGNILVRNNIWYIDPFSGRKQTPSYITPEFPVVQSVVNNTIRIRARYFGWVAGPDVTNTDTSDFQGYVYSMPYDAIIGENCDYFFKSSDMLYTVFSSFQAFSPGSFTFPLSVPIFENSVIAAYEDGTNIVAYFPTGTFNVALYTGSFHFCVTSYGDLIIVDEGSRTVYITDKNQNTTTISIDSVTLPSNIIATSINKAYERSVISINFYTSDRTIYTLNMIHQSAVDIETLDLIPLGIKISSTSVDVSPLLPFKCKAGEKIYCTQNGNLLTYPTEGSVLVGSCFTDGLFSILK